MSVPCFVVMPFGCKATGVEQPAEVDFDRLYDLVYEPALKTLGYTPVRADQDVGACIILEMIQRLTLSELVVADITLSNSNVYYEVGIRHAARPTGCVLTCADWARPSFDLAQMPHLRYSLDDGTVPDEQAEVLRRQLERALPALVRGQSPMTQAVPGYPDDISPDRARNLTDLVESVAAFQRKTKAVRMAPENQRGQLVEELLAEHPPGRPMVSTLCVELLYLVRDHLGWEQARGFIEALPDALRELPVLVEQAALARCKSGDHVTAAAALEELIEREGPTSERYGLLGGRYKKLYAAAADSNEAARFLDRSIESYERGMACDLNDYYPISNLPRLFRARAGPGDDDAAARAAVLTIAACHRAMQRSPADEWVRPTLLGVAFDAGDVAEVERLVKEVRKSGVAAWKLETTIEDLVRSVDQQDEGSLKAALRTHLEALRALL